MKKLMIAVATVACAAGLQAASFNWGGTCVSSSANVDYEGYANENAVYNIYMLSGSVDASAITKYNANTGALTINGATANLLKTYSLTYDDWDAGSFAGEVVEGSADSLNNKYYVITMYDAKADKDLFSAEVFTISGLTDNGGAGEMNIANSLSGTSVGMNLHGVVETVPEPTSGLLLLLGVAGLALRRRRA